ncbi:MAG: DUF1343 domain-containing protein [Pseudomonadales bacterium]
MTFKFGIDQLLSSPVRLKELRSSKVGLIAHPASVSSGNQHSLDALMGIDCHITRAFGPQHGMRGDKQDNMIESSDYLDQTHQIPIVSLYGEHRYPTKEMLEDLDIVLFDLQDVGCRIYTFITTLKYFVEACAIHKCKLWVLDRPNPAGRPIDGLRLEAGQESFVGCAELPTRHGLTTGELALWFNSIAAEPAELEIIEMTDYDPNERPGYGWPSNIRPWINPSPNAASLNMCRSFPGTVLLEGTVLSEGRGTTIPLEVIGAPDFPAQEILELMMEQCPEWLEGVYLRLCFFEPTFHKHVGEMCTGIQIHTDYANYQHGKFKPYRLIAGILKGLKMLYPKADLWRHHDYEYEKNRSPIDIINGGSGLRHWVEDDSLDFESFEAQLQRDELEWAEERKPFLIY